MKNVCLMVQIAPMTISIKSGTASYLIDSLLPSTDSFVNSQEWTLSRAVPDLRLV